MIQNFITTQTRSKNDDVFIDIVLMWWYNFQIRSQGRFLSR